MINKTIEQFNKTLKSQTSKRLTYNSIEQVNCKQRYNIRKKFYFLHNK